MIFIIVIQGKDFPAGTYSTCKFMLFVSFANGAVVNCGTTPLAQRTNQSEKKEFGCVSVIAS
jgi:hypothetical protein